MVVEVIRITSLRTRIGAELVVAKVDKSPLDSAPKTRSKDDQR